MHPWHDVDLGKDFPEIVRCIIEIPKGSNAKYRLDPKTGLIELAEFLPSIARYPANYGFFPRTLAGDGDALDVFVFGGEALVPLTLLKVRVLGAVTTNSKKKGIEYKVIAVCPGDPEFKQYESLKDLPSFYMDELVEFFEDYKALVGDRRHVKEFASRRQTHKLLKDSATAYQKAKNREKLES